MTIYSSRQVANAKAVVELWRAYEALSNSGFKESSKPGLFYDRDSGWDIVFGGNHEDLHRPSTVQQFVQIAKVYRGREHPALNLSEHQTIDLKVLESYKPDLHIN